MLNIEQLLQLLHKDVVPALGCTEPVCVAFCSANAAKLLEGEAERIDVEVNAGIYKNGMSAGIPNCSEVGLHWAAALGAMLSNPEKELGLLEDVTEQIVKKAALRVDGGNVTVRLQEEEKELYVKATLWKGEETSTCIVRGAHTNVVSLSHNGEVVYEVTKTEEGGAEDILVEQLKQMTIGQMRTLVDEMHTEQLEFLMDGVVMNEELADYSKNHAIGVGIGDTFRKELGTAVMQNDLLSRIIVQVSAAAESRLDGCPLPTMSSSGAGTKGLVAILPVSETAKVLKATKEQCVKALALSHLVNRYINAHIGKLSPMCTCVMSASTAAAVGMTYLFGGTNEQIGYAVRNMAGTVTGMICDGGKVGCAMKAATGSSAALLSAITAVHDAPMRVTDGICAKTPEQCILNMAQIGKKAMKQADEEIIRIMVEK